MIPNPPDAFDAWYRAIVDVEPIDPRFHVYRALPDEYERIYDLVDAAFGKKRPRALYDWMYRDNPQGQARCWVVVDRETGEMVKTGASFPWPISDGEEVLLGVLSGDACTAPQWQRKGLSKIRRVFTRGHPMNPQFTGIAGPNEGSRTVSVKAGNARKQLGPLRAATAPVTSRRLLERLGSPAGLAGPIGSAVDAVFTGWRRRALRPGGRDAVRLASVDRFTSDFDDVTLSCMSFRRFWSPHNADFLNWRYLDHPVETYVALALVAAERPVGYAVVGLDGEKATLAEFAVESGDSGQAEALLARVFEVARDAECASLNFFSTPAWRHWPLFRRAGFLPYRSKNHLEAFGREREPDVLQMHNWQLTPGDRDYR